MSGAVERACELIRRFEGLRLEAYPDPATGGAPWTIGYGATGQGIVKGVVWTKAQAEADLLRRVEVLLRALAPLVKHPVPDGATAALASLAYNIGLGALGKSTLLRLLNARDFKGAADEFPKWNKAAGKVFPGLVTRRDAERKVFLIALGLPL